MVYVGGIAAQTILVAGQCHKNELSCSPSGIRIPVVAHKGYSYRGPCGVMGVGLKDKALIKVSLTVVTTTLV